MTGLLALAAAVRLAAEGDLRIGLIGLDTSHVIVVAKAFNDPADKDHLPGAHVVCGYKGGSPDVKKEILSEKLASDHPALNRQILEFFRTRRSPVSLEDTLEVMTFLEAADESKRQGGAPVSLKEVLAKNSPL